MTQPAGTPVVRFGDGIQLQQSGRAARLPATMNRQDAMANDTVRSPIPAKSEEEGFTTTPPCSPSPRSSKDLISEPSTPFSGPRPQPTREEMSVERSTSSTSDEDYVVDSSEEEEAMKSPHYSPRGHHDPPSPTPSPSPAVKMTKKEHNRSYYELNKERLRVENRWRAAARREKKREQLQPFVHVAAPLKGHIHPFHSHWAAYFGAQVFQPQEHPYGIPLVQQQQLPPLPAGAPAMRFRSASQQTPGGRASAEAANVQQQPPAAGRTPTQVQQTSARLPALRSLSSILRSIHSMQAQSNFHRAPPAQNQSLQDALNNTIDTSNALADAEDEGSVSTTPPCSPSSRSSRELSSEPPTPFHTRPPHGEGWEQGAVDKSSSSPIIEDDLIVTSDGEEAMNEPPPRSPRGPPSPTPPPRAKSFCRGMTRKQYFDAYYQKNKARINAKAKERRADGREVASSCGEK
ncbi:hypothetical protein PRIPAC_97323 [Pristionchus pacificus]|uniref:Uncharacterized protein n=1 Tax=Pristionchus pacificus TaxID=54126 RepID=A0A2A6CH26_PRIPA|nr:hypothetical protein PRIPAC_97323 [Pristionchus pacificus]|eukprot:PDM77378.1 hypothetical protein PRIPAC_33108 [Pristionchus pacificus]